MNIQKELFRLQDEAYRDFTAALILNIDKEKIIGVRSPLLKELGKTLLKENSALCKEFIENPVHKYYEENNLHMFLIGRIKDFDECIKEMEAFLPYVDNWSTCDMPLPKVFEKNKERLLCYVKRWLASKEEYTVRYAIGVLMRLFLDDDFSPSYLKYVADIKSDKYYINMMIAWYFATALAKRYDDALFYLENKLLSDWVHNKTIQKAVESYRITDEKKTYLRTLKRK